VPPKNTHRCEIPRRQTHPGISRVEPLIAPSWQETCSLRIAMPTIVILLCAAVATFLAGYATWILVTWRHYGRPIRPSLAEADVLLDQFMPNYEVVERHQVRIDAPADQVLASASRMDLTGVGVVRAIVKARQLLLNAHDDKETPPMGLLDYTRSIGWGDLASAPGREVVLGAITRPWEPNVTFQPVSPDVFREFNEPGFVKIAWTLRADPRADGGSDFRTETRAIATDGTARRKFRWYWARFSAGVALIRWAMLKPLKRDAERSVVRPAA
jgi:hypothetical protein